MIRSCRALCLLAFPLAAGAQSPPTPEARLQAGLVEASGRISRGEFADALAQGRELVALARRLDDPQREVNAWLVVATAQLGIFTPETRLGAAYAMDTAVTALERARRRARTPEARLELLERQAVLLDFWVQGISERGGQGVEGVERSFFGMLAAAERGRARLLAESLGAEVDSVVNPALLEAEGRRLHEVARRTNASVVTYLMAASRLIILYSGPDGSMNIASAAIGDSALTELILEARDALGVDRMTDAARAIAESLSDARGVRGVAPGAADSGAVRRLADLLLPPRILSAIGAARRRDVVIIPHRTIAMVPFAALPLPDGAPSGEIFAYRYAPSLTVLDAVERRNGNSLFDTTRAHSGLVVGDPQMPRVATASGPVTLAALAGARREAEWVADRFGITPFVGADGTETRVREAMRSATVVHLATHGFAYADPLREAESFVALAADGTHDGLLQVHELEAAPGSMVADLVVLSACQTGLGSTRLSEGTIGLPRAFLAAGARTVLVSLWSVNDEATELLMQRFYHYWLEGEGQRTKAQALWRAQNDVRNDPRFSAPRYWAAFQLVGGS